MFYAGDMLRELLTPPPSSADDDNPIRLFAGSGLRQDVWRRVLDRFGPMGILEFYASTEGNAVLANASGEKEGALGQPLPGSAEVALARYDFELGDFVRDERGLLVQPGANEPGVLLARLDSDHPVASFASGDEAGSRLLQGVFEPDDTWFVTWDVLRRDEDGDFWFVDRVGRMLRTSTGVVSTRSIEDALYGFSPFRQVVVYGAESDGHQAPVAVVTTQDDRPMSLDSWNRFAASLPEEQRPLWVRRVAKIPMTDGFRPDKARLEGAPTGSVREVFRLDTGTGRYAELQDSSAATPRDP